MSSTIVGTEASSGSETHTVHTLADAGHTVYAGITIQFPAGHAYTDLLTPARR